MRNLWKCNFSILWSCLGAPFSAFSSGAQSAVDLALMMDFCLWWLQDEGPDDSLRFQASKLEFSLTTSESWAGHVPVPQSLPYEGFVENKQLLLHPENPGAAWREGKIFSCVKFILTSLNSLLAKRVGHPSSKVYIMKTKPRELLWKEDRVLYIKKHDKEISQKDNIVVLGGRIEGCFGICLFPSIC